MPVTKEGNNLLVDGVIEHGVYPTRHDEIDNTVVLRGVYDVRGGIYGRNLLISPGAEGTVHGPIVTAEDLLIDKSGTTKKSIFLSGLVAPRIIRNITSPRPVRETCVTDFKNACMSVRGPVIADTVQLSNTLIIGNIHAKDVRLESCFVFGVIDCESLLLDNCNFVAYRAGRARLLGRSSTWLGFGVSDDGLECLSNTPRPLLEPGGLSAQEQSKADIRFIPICLTGSVCDNAHDAEACNLYHLGKCPSCVSGTSDGALKPVVSLGELDFQFQVEALDPAAPELEFRRIGGLEPVGGSPEALAQVLLNARTPPEDLQVLDPDSGRWESLMKSEAFRRRYRVRRVLSVASRILNTTEVRKQISGITDLGRDIAYWPHYDPAQRAELEKEQFTLKGTEQLFRLGIAQADIRSEAS